MLRVYQSGSRQRDRRTQRSRCHHLLAKKQSVRYRRQRARRPRPPLPRGRRNGNTSRRARDRTCHRLRMHVRNPREFSACSVDSPKSQHREDILSNIIKPIHKKCHHHQRSDRDIQLRHVVSGENVHRPHSSRRVSRRGRRPHDTQQMHTFRGLLESATTALVNSPRKRKFRDELATHDRRLAVQCGVLPTESAASTYVRHSKRNGYDRDQRVRRSHTGLRQTQFFRIVPVHVPTRSISVLAASIADLQGAWRRDVRRAPCTIASGAGR